MIPARPLRFRRLAAASLSLFLFAACALGVASPAFSQAAAKTSHANAASSSNIWWKHAVLYEIYPRSFQDSNGDGVGDLNGITQRLRLPPVPRRRRHLDRAHVPFAPGRLRLRHLRLHAVDPQYGTLADFDRLLAEGKQHNIRVLLDMVLNHTSDKHQWFIDSASSRTNPKPTGTSGTTASPPTAPASPPTRSASSTKAVVPPNNWVVPLRRLRMGVGSRRATSSTITTSTSSSPTSTGATPPSKRPCSMPCASGSTAASPASVSTPSPPSSKIPTLRDEPEAGGSTPRAIPTSTTLYTSNLPRRPRRHPPHAHHGRLLPRRPRPHRRNLPAQHRRAQQWYGGAAHDELHLPMDMLVGFHGDHRQARRRQLPRSPSTKPRPSSTAASPSSSSTTTTTSAPGTATAITSASRTRQKIARLIASLLFTTRATALTLLRRRDRHGHHHARPASKT